ncbi:Putative Flavoprotein-like superfamily [Septoria linicola]|uniref:Bifunctional cytochrome P450/NADPH--P450 reductase n=1 Tax=Septoria linicola TaxID=215465 RepID=A0A9Q9EFS0_9PEZI|nr:Putative Flavoprotein-like superfamily [Septoria linicola]
MSLDRRDTIAIPQPRGYPIIGNVLEVTGDVPINRIIQLGKQYGEIFRLTILGRRLVLVSSQALADELCDEKRFHKYVSAPLAELRDGVHDGLFTAHDGEANWTTAHRTLTPAFNPLNVATMFDDMKDIASQLVLKFARYGQSYRIPVTKDLTALTLDTIALCSMDYRFNSFYTEEEHPFIQAMVSFLKHADVRARRPPWLRALYSSDEAQWQADIACMRDLSETLVKERRDNPKDSKDLLNAMINGKDPKTGECLPESSIIDNLITFLVAGHETTSGMLSYCFYCLLKNPDACRKAQEEVDKVIGMSGVQYEHLNQLPYITAVLRETARLYSTAPGFAVTPNNPNGEVLAGKYFLEAGEPALIVLHNVHRDPAVFGDDAEEFRPERMLDENFDKLPSNSWKPFGNGARGCIGRGFAWQEMMLVMPTLLQYFNFSMDDPQYDLQTAFTLTIKPKDFYMRASLREGWTARKIEQHLSGSSKFDVSKAPGAPTATNEAHGESGKPVTILYGSNSGTCEVLANTLAADARAHGFSASAVKTLDSAKQNLPTDEPVVIVTASYEGEPADDASHFYNWLQHLEPGTKLDTKFAVFGCGHSDWKKTFHRVPTAIDNFLEKAGSTRLCSMGTADAAKGDMMSAFQAWEDDTLWPALQKHYGAEDEATAAKSLGQSVSVEVFSKRASHLRADVAEAKVVAVKTLTTPDVAEKHHVELQLPSDMTYRAGDYLAVLPLNLPGVVHRIMTRFSLPWDAMLHITSKTGTTLPTDHPVSAQNLFSAYLELSQPATKRNLAMLIEASPDDATKSQLSTLSEHFEAEITAKRTSLLALLERFPKIPLPLSAFISSLISMRVRQYSISSSPLSNSNNATLTFAVIDEPSTSGQGRHIGVASNYLSQLKAGDIVHVAVKPSHAAFHLPPSPETTPVIMVAAGAGLAPFRGFIQERAAQIGSGRKLAAAHLYFGCRHPDKDNLYSEEIAFWEKMGAVVTHRSFSQLPEQSGGHKHIDGVFLEDKDSLIPLWEAGARIYVCGSRGLGESVKQAFLKMAREKGIAEGRIDAEDDEKLEKWFESLRNERYSTDVFA